MDKTDEKLKRFSLSVMIEAEKKQKDIIKQAEKARQETIDENEIRFLKQAYEKIQNAVHKLEKEINQEVSKAIIENKQSLFNRREEIINDIFRHVTEKLFAFRHQEGYKSYMENLVNSGLTQVGEGDVTIFADNEDMPLFTELRSSSGVPFKVSESDEELLGGCIIVNRTKNLLCDYSFANSLKAERAAFLENYGISID
jgi:vacuolar-type H+-ATPase subunit E/Vma4